MLGTSAGADVQLNWQAVYRSHLRVLGYSGMVLSRDDRRRSLQPVLLALPTAGCGTRSRGSWLRRADGTRVFESSSGSGGGPGKTLLDLC